MRIFLATILLALLAGCAQSAPSYSPEAASELQKQVLAVSEASAAGELEGTLTRLDELEAMANAARADESISAERHTAILAAIALVRADITAAITVRDTPPPAPAPAPVEEEPDESRGNSDEKGNSDKNDKDDD